MPIISIAEISTQIQTFRLNLPYWSKLNQLWGNSAHKLNVTYWFRKVNLYFETAALKILYVSDNINGALYASIILLTDLKHDVQFSTAKQIWANMFQKWNIKFQQDSIVARIDRWFQKFLKLQLEIYFW